MDNGVSQRNPAWMDADTVPLMIDGPRRDDHQWRMLRYKFRDYCRARNALCHLCVARGDSEHAEIDYFAKANSPRSFEPDHIRPWHLAPQLRYEWSNLAPSHSRCNRQRRNELLKEDGADHGWVKPDW